MSDYAISQNDRSILRSAKLAAARKLYIYNNSIGIPMSSFPNPPLELDGPEWLRQLLSVAIAVRANMAKYMDKTPFSFMNPYPPDMLNKEFLRFALSGITQDSPSFIQNVIDSAANAFEFLLPDLGPGGHVTSIDQFRDLWTSPSMPVPEIARRFETDECFANTFLAGPNPGVIERMTAVPKNFPIETKHLQTAPGFQGDSLQTAISEGRVYFIDHSGLQVLVSGMHYKLTRKFTYAPFAAFVVPKGGGRLMPFAIQCGPSPEGGRLIYTPGDGYSWKIAKNCVLVAHNIHHELNTHLGNTHLLMEPILMATRRQLGDKHPVHALLGHHFEGTMLINFAARTNLIQPGRSVDRLLGCTLESAYSYIKDVRLNYSFTDNYLPKRFARLKTDRFTLLSEYPYRDDALLLWGAIAEWMGEFVTTFYKDDAAVLEDTELQNWAKEISSSSGGMVKDFGSTPGSIKIRQDLVEILTMIIFTSGPQHAAINFPQGTDMAFVPANPMAGFSPEPRGRGHSEADWLKALPPIEVGIIATNILSLLAGVHYTRLGQYSGADSGPLSNFKSGPIAAAVRRFQAKLVSIEEQITKANNKRYVPYIHLLPSKIPQSINI